MLTEPLQKLPIKHNNIMPKLKIGRPDDRFEQQADRVADTVMRMPDQPLQMQPMEGDEDMLQNQSMDVEDILQMQVMDDEEDQLQMQPLEEEEELQMQQLDEEEEQLQMKEQIPGIQKMCPRCQERYRQGKPLNCPECSNKLQMKPAVQMQGNGHIYASPEIAHQMNSTKGQGNLLSHEIRQDMSLKIGTDFSDVNIHTDATSHKLNRQLGARAFTHGNDIYFNKGEYNPTSQSGKQLLAHELTHVVQQSGMGHKKVQRTLGDGHDLLAERFQGRLDLEAAYDNERIIRKGSGGPDVGILQLALIEAGHPLPNFGADGDFGSETQTAVMDFQRNNGLQIDGIIGPRTMEVLDTMFTVGPVIIPSCNNPGVARNVLLQPVFFTCGANDPDPTGGSFFTQLTKANEIWSKLGVTFTTNSPVTLNDCLNKTNGTTEAEQNAIGNLHSGAGIEVYYVDNNLASAGGGSTLSAGNASNVVLSDFGTSETLLAHELGHVLGLGHPPSNAEAGTIMQPSSSHSVANPERNTIGNLAFIVFPVGTDPICLTPDP